MLLAAASIPKSPGTDAVTLPANSTAPDEILARAKAMSVGRKDLLTMVDDMDATKAKGASWRIDAVTGRSSCRY